MVSTNGKSIHGKNRSLGPRTWQVGGYKSDASLQKLSHTTVDVLSGLGSETHNADNAEADATLDFTEQEIGSPLTPMDTPALWMNADKTCALGYVY